MSSEIRGYLCAWVEELSVDEFLFCLLSFKYITVTGYGSWIFCVLLSLCRSQMLGILCELSRSVLFCLCNMVEFLYYVFLWSLLLSGFFSSTRHLVFVYIDFSCCFWFAKFCFMLCLLCYLELVETSSMFCSRSCVVGLTVFDASYLTLIWSLTFPPSFLVFIFSRIILIIWVPNFLHYA